MRTTKTKKQAQPRHGFEVPEPVGQVEIKGHQMVVIPAEVWEEIIELIEDYTDLREAKAVMADQKDDVISLEEARKTILDNRIKRVRKRKKITQKELAKRLGVGQTRVSQIEDPDYRPTIKTYRRVAKALGCEVKDLI